MHIGFDISVLRIAQAGVLVYTRAILDALAAEACDHHLTLLDVLPLNPGRPMRPLAALDAPNARVVRCAGLRRGYLSALPALRRGPGHAAAAAVDRALDPAWGVAATAAIGLALRGGLAGVDVFHASDQFAYAPPGAAAVLTIHDVATRVEPAWHVDATHELHVAKERFAIERADRVIAVSQATARDITAHLGIPPGRIRVVYEAADPRFRPLPPAETAPALARYGLRHGEYLLALGTLEPRKNYPRLIAAYAALRAALPDAPPLAIAGGRGWRYAETLAAPASAGVARQVAFLGRVPDADLPALLAGAALFVYPSLYEGFGLPPLEALAAGVPVVVSDTSSLPEVVGEAALLCDPHDPASIAAAMRAVLADPERAAGLRQAGPPRAAEFSWARAARETLAVYAEAVEAARQR